ncbi:MAG: redoxin domain-containing protein [Alphaproteobacteria bacterium]|nr:redoxin domain-containing protein [Alphaproteobacteria bacterium]
MRMKFRILLAIAAMMWAPAALALDVGPAVGTHIPEFHAQDDQAKPVGLKDIAGKNGTVLVFFRSAKWCPYCQAQLIDLKKAAAPLEQRGYRLVAISYDDPEVLATFTKRRDIPYTLLSDKGSVMIDAFKLRDPQYPPGNMAYGVPQPSIFVISPDGIVRAKLAEEGFKHRPSNEAILAAVDGLK